MPKKGSILATTFDHYEVIDSLGAGGSGDVLSAQDSSGAEFAIKLLRPNQPRAKKLRFKNELAFCATNIHPNIVKVVDRGVIGAGTDEQPFYVMPLYKSTLRRFLASGAPREKALEVFAKMLDGVEAAHLRGIFHRDLKPENILMNPPTDEVVVADFGIAHFEEDNLLTAVETEVGDRLANWEYAAPEQRRRGQQIDHRADIYSLGLMLNELFTGQVPHGADPLAIASMAPEYAYLDDVANAMRQNSPERRPNSIAQIKNMLIARGNDFVQQQKLDALKNTVIPASEISDPLISSPITLSDVDYRNGQLIFTISRSPNTRWQRHFRNMGSFSGVVGSGPEYFAFNGNTAIVSATESTAQMVVNHFKNYLQRTNTLYAQDLKTQVEREEYERRQQLQEAIAREEKERDIRQRIKSQLRW
jgi:serine/threonine protein kinase